MQTPGPPEIYRRPGRHPGKGQVAGARSAPEQGSVGARTTAVTGGRPTSGRASSTATERLIKEAHVGNVYGVMSASWAAPRGDRSFCVSFEIGSVNVPPVMRPCPRRPPRPMIKAAPNGRSASGPAGRWSVLRKDPALRRRPRRARCGLGYAVPRLGSIAAARAMLYELADTSQRVILGTNRDAAVGRHRCAVPLGGPRYVADRCGANAGPGWQPWRLDSDDHRFPPCPLAR